MYIWCQLLNPHLRMHYSNIGVHIFWGVVLRPVYLDGPTFNNKDRFTWGLKPQMPHMLANPKMKAKSQLLSLKKPL